MGEPDATEGRGDGEVRPDLVVGLGASAGGLKPLEEFFDELDTGLGAAYVVVQHLDPDRPSLSTDLLQRHTSMPVRTAEEGAALGPDEVFVTPPNHRITVEDGVLHLTSPRRDSGRPTVIDSFFRSLAREYRGNAVGVLFSGSGSDGAVGTTQIREAGGLTMVQQPDTAEFSGMPDAAIATGDVDVVLPTDGLAGYLASYAARQERVSLPREPREETDDVLAGIVARLKEQTNVDFSLYKDSTLLRRIERRLLMSEVEDLPSYLALLEDDPQEVATLHDDLLIGVSSFFRDPDAFRILEEKVIPRIVRRDEEEEGKVRIWVPACGSGQEAYSIAMLLAEQRASSPHTPPVKMFATDVDESALSVARKGRYPRGIEDEVPARFLERYFDAVAGGDMYQVKSKLRSMILFSKQNVLADPPFSNIDLVSCRNFAIYLRPEAQRDLLRIFHFAIRPGGFLFLGDTESLGRRDDLFRRFEDGARLFERRDVVPEMPVPISGDNVRAGSSVSGESLFGAPQVSSGETGRGRFERRVERALLDQLAPTCVVVNRNREILYFHGETSAYLEHPPGSPSHDVVDMARSDLRGELRRGLRHAVQDGETVRRQGVSAGVGREVPEVDLTVRPLQVGKDVDELYLVTFERSAAAEEALEERDAVHLEDDASADEVAELERELRETRERLQATIEELESSNEELRSMNEELQTANEELQTSREEARAANEELQTVNEELNAKIDELRKARSDLENLLRSTKIATVFVDQELEVKRFTPAATSIFRLQERDRGRPLEDIATRLELPEGLDLVDEMEGVLDSLRPVEHEVKVPEDDHWYTMRVMPYRSVDDRIEGLVLTFTDVTKLKRLELARSKLVALMEGMTDAIVGRSPDGTITTWNEGARRLFGYSEEEALGRDIRMLVPEDRREELERFHDQVADDAWTEPVDTMRVGADGERMHVSVNYSCIRDPEGEVVEIAGIARDISERVEARETLERINQRKTEFMAMLSHELRNPLAPMRHAVDMLRGEGASDPGSRERALEILDRQVGYLKRLVDDLTDIARISSGSLNLDVGIVDLSELARRTVQDYRGIAEEAGIEVSMRAPEQPVEIRGDPDRLTQVLGNLIDNAIRHTPSDGEVRVRVQRHEEAATVAVEDDGPGLSDHDRDAVFEPFRQLESGDNAVAGGLGLGLAVARRIAELHGGTLTAVSEGPGTGSTFRLELSLAEADRLESRGSENRTGAEDEPVPSEVPGRRVLVIEDYEDAAEMLAMTLESLGNEVELAGDAEEGVRRAREFRPDVVLCDIGLPGDRDGYEVARRLRSDPDLSGLRLVAITGFGADLDRERASEAGFDEHLTKPVASDDLGRVLSG